MTRTEQKYLLYAVYCTVQGIVMLVVMTYSWLKWRKGYLADRKGCDDTFLVVFCVTAFLKFANTWVMLYNWGEFIDPPD